MNGAEEVFFSDATFAFLGRLAANNRREWFQEHRQDYEDAVREPALRLIRAMQPHLAAISPHFVADARKSGGSLMRVHRDTRFSRDKTPYKTNIGIQFRHELGRDVHAPGFYLHISPAEVFVGVGIWHPAGDALARIRKAMDDEPQAWLTVRDDEQFSRWFELAGDSLKRPPRGYDREHPLIGDIKRKDFIGISHIQADLIVLEGLDRMLADYFAVGAPLMRFLCRALRIPF